LSLYQVDIDDHSNFDLVLDTSRLTSVEVFEKVTDFIDSLST
jgi:cytidylate kinase